MKRILPLILLAVFAFSFAIAQDSHQSGNNQSGPKSEDNHSNGNGPFQNMDGQYQSSGLIFNLGFDFLTEEFANNVDNKAGVSTAGNGIKTGGLTRVSRIPFLVGSSLMTPSGWGSSGTYVFGGLGGTPNQVYASTQTQRADLIGMVGVGFGNASKFASFVGIVNINDVSAVDNFSYSAMASRQLGKLSSITVGAVHLFADPKKTDAPPSYYVAYSQAIRKTKLSYTIGVGTGRFYGNSGLDKYYGKPAHGTGVFANVSYNLLRNLAVSTDWTGTNLAFSSTYMFKEKWPVLSVGVSQVTRLTGDHPTVFAAIGKAFSFGMKGKK